MLRARRSTPSAVRKRLRQSEPTVDAVVQRALQPLHRRRLRGAHGQAAKEARQAAHAFAAHRIALVRHGRRTRLFRLERLVDLLPMGQQPQIGPVFMGGLAEAGKRVENLRIDFTRVCLSGYGINSVKAHLAGDQGVESPYLGVIAVKEREETGLRPGRALGAAEAQGLQTVFDLVKVEEKIVAPQAGAFAHCGQLARVGNA